MKTRWTFCLAAALVLWGCASRPVKRKAQPAPLPQTVTNAFTENLRAKGPAPQRPANTNWLTWTETGESNIVYEVWRSTNLPPRFNTFTLWQRANHPPVRLTQDPRCQFFLCRASNTVSRLTSQWNGP